jgi:hypothetical protein
VLEETVKPAVGVDVAVAATQGKDQSASASASTPAAPVATPSHGRKPRHKQKAAHPSSLSSLTSPPSPLDPSIDASRLYDTSERRTARQAALASSASEPLPASVRQRNTNNVPLHKEKPLNEEWREVVVEKLDQKVKAPGVSQLTLQHCNKRRKGNVASIAAGGCISARGSRI